MNAKAIGALWRLIFICGASISLGVEFGVAPALALLFSLLAIDQVIAGPK